MVLLLGLDVGTQGTKAVLYDDEKRAILARASSSYPILPTDVPGRAEQDPETWLAACRDTIRAVLKEVDDPARVKGIGVSGQQHSLVALGAGDEVLRPAKLWCDVESHQEADTLSQSLGAVMVPSITLTKLLWMKNNEPGNYANLKTVMLPHDYINFKLTGRKCMERGDASGVGGLNIASAQFETSALNFVDSTLVQKLPSVIGPDEAVGNLTREMADALGLTRDVVVSPGSGDNMMSALGAGAVRDGTLVLSLGTSACLFAVSSKPIQDSTGVVNGFCDATGKWLPLVCIMNCTRVLEEVKTCFGLSHEELTNLAEREPPGCNGVNFLPYLIGERTPNWPHARGVIHGLSPGSLRPGLLYRAAMEGATNTVFAAFQRMKELGVTSKELRLVGGASKNRLWRRIVADTFQLPVRFPLEQESAAFGASLQAGAVVRGESIAEYVEKQEVPMDESVITPDSTLRALYEDNVYTHREIGNKLFGS